MAQEVPEFSCKTSIQSPAPVLLEGVQERVADLLLTCSGGIPSDTVTDITVTLNAPLIAGEPQLIINGPASSEANNDTFQGTLESGSIKFRAVSFRYPGNGTLTLRITNVRVDASRLPEHLIPVMMVVSAASFPIVDSIQTVGLVRNASAKREAVQGTTIPSPFTCSSTGAGVPPIVRGEGLSELVADLILNCTGGTPTPSGAPVPTADVRVFINTNLSGRLTNADFSEALLLIDDPAPAQQVACTPGPCAVTGAGASGVNFLNGSNPNVFQARQTVLNGLTWFNVPIDPPGPGATRIFRFTNIRANAAQIGISSSLIPTQVVAFTTIGGVPINAPNQTVAFILSGQSGALTDAAGNTVSSLSFAQSGGANTALISSSAATGGAGNYLVSVREGFSNAFRRRNFSTTTTVSQNNPGAIYNTETGFYNAAFTATNGLNSAGLPTQGTRIAAKFSNIPTGATLYVTVKPVNTAANIVLVSTDSSGSGAYSPVNQTTTALFGSSQFGIAPVTITNGSGMAVWEVVSGDDPLFVQIFNFGIVAAYASPLAPGTVTTSFAPLSSTTTSDASSPLPRFAGGNTTPSKAVLINPTPGATLGVSSLNFTWASSNVPQYHLYVGTTGVGSNNLFNQNLGGATMQFVSGIPTDGRTIYVRLWSLLPSGWDYNDYTYATAVTSRKAVLTTPAPSTLLAATSVTFSWDAGVGVTQYHLAVGVSGVGSTELFNSNLAAARTQAVSNLPSNGGTVYVRLWSLMEGAWVFNDYTYTAATGQGKAVMQSPQPGSTLGTSSVTFIWNNTGATQYQLNVGTTGVGSNNLFTQNLGGATSQLVSGIPADGRTVYVRLLTLLASGWDYNDYTYTAAAASPKANLTSPVPSTALSSSSATFSWDSGVNVTQYHLAVGVSGVGSTELFNLNLGLARTQVVSNLPTNGGTVYVRLWSLIGGAWVFNDYTYTAATGSKAVMQLPQPGSTLGTSSVTFTWNSSGVPQYHLYVGTTGAGSTNLFTQNLGGATSQLVNGIPTDGRTVFVRLWSLLSTGWDYNDYTYATVGTGVTSQKANITSPAPSTVLSSFSATFSWDAGIGVTQYHLAVGVSGVGSTELFNSNLGAARTQVLSNLPTNGGTVYVRLWSFIGTWVFNDYTYTAATASKAYIRSPFSGSTLGTSSVTFTWDNSGAPQYHLYVGTTGAGSTNLFTQNLGAATSQSVSGIPSDGRIVWVRLWSLLSTGWDYTDATFQTIAGASPKAKLTSPAPFTSLTSTSATFTWDAGIGVTQYQLAIGVSGVGSTEVFNANLGTARTQTVSNLPSNGGTIYVRLWSLIGTWVFTDYTYTAVSGLAKAAMLSPTPGSTIGTSSVTFTWSAGDGTQYFIQVGTAGAGTYNILSISTDSATTRTVNNLPVNATTILYVRLWTKLAGVWQYTDYTYTATNAAPPVKAIMISPVPGSTLTSSSVTFTWSAGVGVTGYWLSVGITGVGSPDLFSLNVSGTSKLIERIPTDGAPVYVRLFSQYAGSVYAFEDYIYSPAGTLTKAAMQSPAPGSVLSGPNVTFNWSQGIGPSAYRLTAGFAGPGSDTIGLSASSATTQLVTALPTDGSILYVRLFSLIGDVWQFNDYTYTTAAGSTKGAMQSPAPGSTLAGATVTFNWSVGSGATQYRIDAGSTGFGSSNLFSNNTGTATTQTISGLPRNESNVYVRLWSLVGGIWQY